MNGSTPSVSKEFAWISPTETTSGSPAPLALNPGGLPMRLIEEKGLRRRPVEIIRAIEREIPRRAFRLTERDKLRGIFEWQRLEQHGIDHRKYRVLAPMPRARVMTATAVKPGVFAQHAEAEADVLQQGFEPGDAAEVVLRFAELRGTSEAEAGLAAGFVGREAAADVFLGEHVEVRGKLALKIFVEAMAREEAADAGSKTRNRESIG